MQKQTKPIPKVRKDLRMDAIIRTVLLDLEEPLGVDLSIVLRYALVSGPEAFRCVVEQETAKAETSLAEGRLIQYLALRQIEALLAKNVDWGGVPASSRRAKAMAKFSHGERVCARANKRLDFYGRHPSRLTDPVAHAIGFAQLLAQDILGPLDEGAYAEMHELCVHGPGATLLEKTKAWESNFIAKLDPGYRHSITTEAIPWLLEYGHQNPHWVNYLVSGGGSYERVRGNRVTTVPKKWDSDRTIGIEPSLNVFLQLGRGRYIANRLRRFGVTLSDQRPNQHSARRGSVDGDLVTLDISNASGTLSRACVELVLPREWFVHLDALRSKEYRIGSQQWVRYEQFSSMGNGFTFPLESLIFYTVIRGCVSQTGDDPRLIRVFGDDLVVPTGSAALVTEVLRFLGFAVNSEKSHFFGYFRESCGTDFAQGLNVRPVYLESCPTTCADVYDLYNRLLTNSMCDLPQTLALLRTFAPENDVPPDLGLSELKGEGWRPGISARFDTGFMADSPQPAGYCSSNQSIYYTYTMLTFRYAKLKAWQFGEGTLYFAFLLGADVNKAQDNRRQVWYRREAFCFTWIPVQDVRDAVWRRRCSHRRG